MCNEYSISITMQQTLNFNSRQILSKEELKAWDESLRELVGNFFRYSRSNARVGGILDFYDTEALTLENDFFKVELGSVPSSGYNTLKIAAGRGILGVQNTTGEYVNGLNGASTSLKNQLVALMKWTAKDNLVVSGITGYTSGTVVYVGFSPIWNPLEEGICAISATNQVTITGGTFDKLRGQSTKNPTKIRFYTESDQGAVSPTNHDIYEVVTWTSSTQITISGTVSAETNLKMMIVGSYDLAAQDVMTDKFSYVTANGLLTFTETATNITTYGGFIIASLTFGNAGAFTIQDLRPDNLFNFSYSLYGVKIKAILDTDYTYSGITTDFIIGAVEAPLVVGNAVCVEGTDTVNVATTSTSNPAIGVVVKLITDGNVGSTVTVMLNGFIRKTVPWLSAAAQKVYLGTNGVITTTAPTTPGEFTQLLGIATNTDRMYFNPQLVMTEVV